MTWPSVTQILDPYTDFSMIPEHVLFHATERGRKVHSICAAILQGLWIPKVDPECAGYIASFQTWKDQFVEEVIYVEHELVDPAYGFIGHIDFFGKLRKLGYGLIDWKTPVGTPKKTWRLQMSAYRRLLEVAKKKIDIVSVLQFNPDGTIPKMTRYEGTSASDFNVFLGILNAHNF